MDIRTNLARTTESSLKENYGRFIKVYQTVIPVATKVAEASAARKSIYNYDKIRIMEQNGQDCYAFLVKEEVDRMRIDNIDIYKLPRWLEGIFEEVERICYETLEEESGFYKGVFEETYELPDKYDFFSTIAANDEIREPMNLSITEVQMYLLGRRHMWELTESLGVILQ